MILYRLGAGDQRRMQIEEIDQNAAAIGLRRLPAEPDGTLNGFVHDQ